MRVKLVLIISGSLLQDDLRITTRWHKFLILGLLGLSQVSLTLSQLSLKVGVQNNLSCLIARVTVVTLDYTSTDDLFTLTAALSNGDHCYVLSNDYYRQYYHIIGNNLASLKCLPKTSYFSQGQAWVVQGILSVASFSSDQDWLVPRLREGEDSRRGDSL